MGTYLDGILAWHRRRAASDPRDADDLLERAGATLSADPVRDFAGALRRGGAGPASSCPALIAELKRRSPSKGDLAPDLDPAALASSYEAGGAAALSVLTDEPHFGGSPSDLAAARSATRIPVLRKDFTVAPSDVCDARLMGADAVLLIVAGLADDELGRLLELTTSLGMSALVEVHDEAEASRALAAGASLVGVNQRDLHSFEVDTERAVRLAAALPDGVTKVAESGIRGHDDAERLREAGYDAVLVGESLLTSDDPQAAVRALLNRSDVPCG